MTVDVQQAWDVDVADPTMIVIRPQPKQEQFHSSPADIVIYGGAAGGG